MRYVLDTNAVSALMKGDRHFIARLRKLDRADVGVPQPVFAEIAYGIERLPRSKRRNSLQERLDLVRTELARVAWTAPVSDYFGAVKAERRGKRIEDFDAAIAAHALAEDAVLVTASADDMGRVPGLTIEDWAAM